MSSLTETTSSKNCLVSLTDNLYNLKILCVQVNTEPRQPVFVDECQSDTAHAQLLSARVKLQDGVWLVEDNIRMHDTFMVKLKVCRAYTAYISL